MNRSYWEKEHWLTNLDYVIVGAGLTGLQTALALRESQKKAEILVVDRAAWSQGASLKNAGFACFMNLSEHMDDLNHMSEFEALELVKNRYDGLKKLKESFGDEHIGFEQNGSHEVFTKANRPNLEKSLDHLQKVNNQLHDILGLERVFTYKSSIGIREGLGAIENAYEGELNTGKLFQRVYSACMEQNIKIMGGLNLEGWSKGDQMELHFKEGVDLKCETLVLCTNAFTAAFVDEDIVPARGQVLLTEPLENSHEGIFMYDKGDYYWRTVDQRILLGGARLKDKLGEQQFEFGGNKAVVEELKRFLFEEILGRQVQIDYQWSGIMGMGARGHASPIIKEVEPNVFMGARLGGMGVALSAIVAEQLKNKVLGL